MKYEDSIIVNISALSLQELQNRRRNGLLGMNLRYYVRQKAVDTGIEKTIHKEPENFWYKNNGILIICDDYEIDGKEIKLWNFSIVNGGQTTNRIGKLDIEKDFYLQCKVVKSKGNTTQMKDKFALEIAEATNSQKPVKKADLKANTPEQIRLKERLNRCQVYYITKKVIKHQNNIQNLIKQQRLNRLESWAWQQFYRCLDQLVVILRECIMMSITILFLDKMQKRG